MSAHPSTDAERLRACGIAGHYTANAEAQRSPAAGDKLPPLVGRDGGKR